VNATCTKQTEAHLDLDYNSKKEEISKILDTVIKPSEQHQNIPYELKKQRKKKRKRN
jgi:hypothetical protein